MTPTGKDKFSLAAAICEAEGEAYAWELLDRNVHGGRTTVHWFTFPDSISQTKKMIQKRAGETAGFDPFDGNTEPELEQSPKILAARWISESRLQIFFGRVRVQRLVVGLEPVEIEKTHFNTGTIDIEKRTVEVWAEEQSYNQIAQICSQVVSDEAFLSLIVPTNKLNEFQNELGASLIKDQFKDDSGPYDSIVLTVPRNGESLDSIPDYAENHAGKPHINKNLAFSLPGQTNVEIIEITKFGGIRFRGFATRKSVDHVLQCARAVVGLQTA